MAKKTKRTVEVDFTDVEVGGGGGFHIPEGEYAMKVDSVKLGTSSNDNEQIEWIFKGTEGKAKGKTFYFYTPLVEQALWKLRETLEALGVEVPDSAMDIDLDELEGMECTGQVEDDEYKNKIRSKLAKLVGEASESTDEAEEDTSPGKKKANGKGKKLIKVSEEEVKEMGEDELEDLVGKYDLDVDLGDFKILRKKIAAVVAALEEKDLIEAE
jgi:hypothetical protein